MYLVAGSIVDRENIRFVGCGGFANSQCDVDNEGKDEKMARNESIPVTVVEEERAARRANS